MQNTYWNKNGTYQAEYDRLVGLMPSVGNCETVAGELIRSATRLAYDFYNNGMGNNTSGALNFLSSKNAVTASDYATIYEFTRGRVYPGGYNGDQLHVAIESMIDTVVKHILDNPELETAANAEDMFDYSDPDQEFCDECGDEISSCNRGSWGHTCSSCEAYGDNYDDEDEEF